MRAEDKGKRDKRVTESEFECISEIIPLGKDNAISRQELCRLTGLADRENRRLIEEARNKGEIIINLQDGRGYYKTEDLAEIKAQYLINNNRAMSILVQQKHLRRKLKAAGLLEKGE